MKPKRLAILFTEIIAALFVLLFLYTAISKLKDLAGFTQSMTESELIKPYATQLAWLIPRTEIITTLLLIFPRTRYIGLIASTIMMAVFTTYIGYMLMTSSRLPCTCGGIIESMSWSTHLIFNSVLLLLGAAGIILSNKNFIMINRNSRIPVENSRQIFD